MFATAIFLFLNIFITLVRAYFKLFLNKLQLFISATRSVVKIFCRLGTICYSNLMFAFRPVAHTHVRLN